MRMGNNFVVVDGAVVGFGVGSFHGEVDCVEIGSNCLLDFVIEFGNSVLILQMCDSLDTMLFGEFENTMMQSREKNSFFYDKSEAICRWTLDDNETGRGTGSFFILLVFIPRDRSEISRRMISSHSLWASFVHAQFLGLSQ